MKQIANSVGQIWRHAIRRRRTRSQENLSQPKPQFQPRPQSQIQSAPVVQEPFIEPASLSISDIQCNLTFDVLSQIFTTYNNVSRDNYNDYHNKGIPWILGQICHSWRQVALNIPHLWNYFTLEITEDNADGDLPEMYQSLLARSANAPLRIRINFMRYYDPIPRYPFRILEPVLERCAQWTTLLLQGLDVSDLERQFGSTRGNLTSLWSLKIYFRTKRGGAVLSGGRGQRYLDLFKDAPALTLVLLNDSFNSLDHREIVLPWHQIKTYAAYNIPGTPFPHELDRQPNLESLTTIYDEFPLIDPREIVHQNLRELYVYSMHNIENSFEQISQLSLPSLELLVVTFMTMELRRNVSIIPSVISLIQNSNCNLKILAIQQNSNLHINQLPTLFSLTPTLETLDIGHGAWFRDILAQLRFDPDKETLLPNLKRLTIAYTTGTSPIDIKLIRELVESRKQVFNDPAHTGQLLQPLLHIRLHIKRSETRYWCMMDLEGRYVPPEGHTNTDTYCPNLDMDPEWETKLKKAMDELRPLLDSPTRTSGSGTAQIVAKYHEVEDIYRRHVLDTSLDPTSGESEPTQALRALVNTHVPAEYLQQRKWVAAADFNLLYLHPDHESRTSTQKADIVIGLKFPPATGFEGYGYWFSADIDRQMENMRPFIC